MATNVTTISQIIASVTSLFILLPLFISFLKKLYCGGVNTDKTSKIITIFVFILNIIQHISASVCYIFVASSDDKNANNLVIDIVGMVAWNSLGGGVVLIYIYLLFRIQNTFNETTYKIKSGIIYLHLINITFIFISVCILWFLLRTDRPKFITYSPIILVVLLIVGYIDLLYTFNHNLFLLVLSQTTDIELNERQHTLLNTIRKHSILAGFMLFTSFTLIILLFLISYYRSKYGYAISATPNIIGTLWAFSFFIFVNTGPLCIYLGFEMNRNLYNKLCGLCDKKCENICISVVEKRLKKQSQTAPDT